MINFLLNQNQGLEIKIFSIYHLFFIVLTFLICLLIIINKNYFINLKNSKKKKLRYIIAFILIINFILRRGSYIVFNIYDYHYHLDINFCNFTSIVFLIYCLTGNKKIYNISYYMILTGPLMAILLPSANLSLLNYSFYSFVILHYLIFISNLIFMYCEDYKYSKENFIKYLIFITLYSVLVYLFNFIFGTSYNLPLSFVNNNLDNSLIIRIVSYNDLTLYLTFYGFVIGLPFLAKELLKRLKK